MNNTPLTDAAIAEHRANPQGPVVSAKFACELEANLTAVRARLAAVEAALGKKEIAYVDQVARADTSERERDDARAAIVKARDALKWANPRANCEVVAFDGVERTITLQFEHMPESCVGERWVAMKAKP